MILRENYKKSVLAAEGMKEALERMDSALLFAVGGEEVQARDQFREFRPKFEENLAIERGNVTLPGERELADALVTLFDRYVALSDRFLALPPAAKEERTKLYFGQLLADCSSTRSRRRPTTCSISIQRNMEDENRRAREGGVNVGPANDSRAMVGSGGGRDDHRADLLSRSILGPVRDVTAGRARAPTRGDLDQVVAATTPRRAGGAGPGLQRDGPDDPRVPPIGHGAAGFRRPEDASAGDDRAIRN